MHLAEKCIIPQKNSQHFPDDEYMQICKLVSDKIVEFTEIFESTELNTILSQKLSEIANIIMNCVEYPIEIFNIPELFLGCKILLLSDDISLIQTSIRFISLAIYSTNNLTEYISELFPVIFEINETSSDIFIKIYLSLLTNIFTDLKNNNSALIDNLLSDYFQNIMEYISSFDKIYREELIFLMVLTQFISSEKDYDAYIQFTNFVLNLLNDQNISADEDYQSIILWSIYENCKHNTKEFIDIVLSLDFFRCLIDNISNYDTFPSCCIEPILIILYLCICSQQEISFISQDDLPIFLHYCMYPNIHIQFDALQLIRQLIQHYPSEFLTLSTHELIDIFDDVQFKSAKEIFLIACSLLYHMPNSYLVSNYNVAQQLIQFIILNINFDTECSKFALLSLIEIQSEFIKLDRLQDFCQIFEEANQYGSFDQLKDDQSNEILDLIDALESS